METIFLTGISGLLGTNVAIKLLDENYYVKAIVRDKVKYRKVQHKNLKLIQASLFDDLSDHLKGCDYVIHAAAETRQNLIKYSDYWKVNYNATVQLFNMTAKYKLKKFVFVSTANTMGNGSLEQPGNEETPVKFPFSKSFYAKSKIEAEDYLISHKDKIDVAIINPTFMLGAYDTKPSSGKIILRALKKKFIFCPPGGKNFVHVNDVAFAISKSLKITNGGNRILIANNNYSYFEFYKKLCAITNQNSRIIKLPKTVLLLLGLIGNIIRMLGIKSSISSINMNILCTYNYFSNAKSLKIFGMQYLSLEYSIRDAVNYFNTNNIK